MHTSLGQRTHAKSRRWLHFAAWLAALAISIAAAAPPADYWPGLRGPDGTARVNKAVLSSEHPRLGVVWSVPVPGAGWASPVVHEGQVFLSTCYANSTALLVEHSCAWAASLAVAFTAFLVLRPASSNHFSAGRLYWIAVHLWTLLVLVAVGHRLLGCQNDTLRTGIFLLLLITVGLDTSRVLTQESTRFQLGIAVAGIILGATAMVYFATLPWLRRPWILFSICLLPLFCTAASLVTVFAPTSTRVCRQHLLAPVVFVLLPAGIILLTTLQEVRKPFWNFQPVRQLVLPSAYVWLAGSVLVAGLLVCGSVAWQRRARVPGLFLLGLASVLGLPLLLQPLVNHFQYSRYQFVRGRFESPLGIGGIGVVAGLMAMTGLVAPFICSRRGELLAGGRRAPGSSALLAFVASAVAGLGVVAGSHGGTVAVLLALDELTGKVLWLREGIASAPQPRGSSWNSLASATPTICDGLVVGYYGERGAFACDSKTGRLRWTCVDLPYASNYGAASSPASIPGGVALQSDSEGEVSYVLALSAANGRPLWRHAREGVPTWRSPMVFAWEGRTTLCSWEHDVCDFLDASDGALLKRVWGTGCGEGAAVCSPSVVGSSVYLAGAERVVAISLPQLRTSSARDLHLEVAGDRGGRRPRLKPEWVAELEGDGPVCSSPVSNDRWLFTCGDNGSLLCFERTSGGICWRTDIGDTKSSAVIAGDYLFVVNEEGVLHAYSLAGSEPLLADQLNLGQQTLASPAVSNGRLYVRTQTRLHCIRGIP